MVFNTIYAQHLKLEGYFIFLPLANELYGSWNFCKWVSITNESGKYISDRGKRGKEKLKTYQG
jgi:hypothetical protein